MKVPYVPVWLGKYATAYELQIGETPFGVWAGVRRLKYWRTSGPFFIHFIWKGEPL